MLCTFFFCSFSRNSLNPLFFYNFSRGENIAFDASRNFFLHLVKIECESFREMCISISISPWHWLWCSLVFLALTLYHSKGNNNLNKIKSTKRMKQYDLVYALKMPWIHWSCKNVIKHRNFSFRFVSFYFPFVSVFFFSSLVRQFVRVVQQATVYLQTYWRRIYIVFFCHFPSGYVFIVVSMHLTEFQTDITCAWAYHLRMYIEHVDYYYLLHSDIRDAVNVLMHVTVFVNKRLNFGVLSENMSLIIA